ncbi:MAG: hypothetical protein Greene041662_213 [Candidatus Peregrinibacteria bacterium Greene0416_62]|nr:MAG: hypothetical protein Greene041662_213 [Candidatus Peregrinibacteria bacterium Greene0416_62]TSC99566.1 MAG: hypothetical protein Greene101449_601 [Candidatus Peregrinibacteria bacterium Greene1014_49]
MLVTVDTGGALIGTGTVFVEAGALGCTDQVTLTGTLCICGASIGTRTGNGDTGSILTDGMRDEATANGRLAGTGARARENDAGNTLAFRVLAAANCGSTGRGTGARNRDALILSVTFVVPSATAKNHSTLIRSRTGKDKAKGVIRRTFVMGDAIRIGDALILSRSIHRYAGVFLADVMLLAVVVRDASAVFIAGDNDTLALGIACEMFRGVEAVSIIETIIVCFSRKRDANALGVTDKVLARVTFITLSAFIRSISVDDNTEVRDACEVFIGFETVSIGCTFILSYSIHGNAGVAGADIIFGTVVVRDAFIVGGTGYLNTLSSSSILALGMYAFVIKEAFIGTLTGNSDTAFIFTFGVFFASNRIGALISTITIHLHTLIAFAHLMREGTATKDNIASIFPISSNDNAGSIILVTFRVFFAADSDRAFIRPIALYFNTLIMNSAYKLVSNTTTKDRIAFIFSGGSINNAGGTPANGIPARTAHCGVAKIIFAGNIRTYRSFCNR